MGAHFSSSAKRTASRAIDYFVGTILIASAVLKAVSPAESATLAAAYGLPTWTSLLLIQLEVVLGVLLLTGIAGGIGRKVALLAFLLFACFSAYRGLAGYETCGCFGAIVIHPWITFTIDVFLISLLAWNVRQPVAAPRTSQWRPALAFVAWLIIAGTTLGLAYTSRPQTLASDDVAATPLNGLVILEPETWIGNRLPISRHIVPQVDLLRGDWTLLLYHHDCPDCQAALPHYQQLAAHSGSHSVLLVEIPPFGNILHHEPAMMCRLSDTADWFVQAPVEIQVSDGIVRRASRDLPSIAALRGQLNYVAKQ